MLSPRVLAKVEALVPETARRAALTALAAYEGDTPAGRERVQLAILRLAAHRPERIPEWVALARQDYRDVLSPAEYPRQHALGFVGMERLDEAERTRVIAEDRAEYEAWLDARR